MYVSVPELKSTLSMAGETYADADITLALDAASELVDRVTGTSFAKDTSDVARYFTAYSADVLSIDDLAALTELATDEDGDGVFEAVWAATDFVLEPLNAATLGRPWALVRRLPSGARRFPPRSRAVRITGRWGWPAVPAAVREATSILAGRLLKRARETPFGVAGLGLDDQAVRITRVDPDVSALLRAYVRRGGML